MMLNFDRIQHLLSPEEFQDKLVVQIGVGSGGAVVNDHLAMNGVRRWILIDPDHYDEVNLVKHPRLRSDLGELKVEIQKRWILDRNPTAEVEAIAEDVMHSAGFSDAARNADLLLCCADVQPVRLYVNSVAVKVGKPCVTASVFRQGFGGEAYAYVPSKSGCFDCMLRVAEQQGLNMEDDIQLLDEEKDAIYGLNQRDFRASGLSMDIQAVAIIQARMALDVLLGDEERRFEPVPANWVVFYNRRVQQNPQSGFLKSVSIKLKPQRDCACATDETTET